MPHIKINDISMYYETYGKGEPVVFIDGFSADHTEWSAVVGHFKEKYQVILFDNRGAGQTDAPDELYSIEQMTNDVAGLCIGLGLDQAHFVASSMGGFILQTLALNHPQLVKSASICCSVAQVHTPFQLYVQAQLEMRQAKVPEQIMIKAICSWLFSFQFISQPGMLELLIEMGVRNPYPFSDTGYKGQCAALRQFDSSAWVNDINVPVLVLGADHDLVFKEAYVRQLAEQIPDARYYCFSECGHLPQIEYPEKFSQVIQEFIATLN